MDEYMNLALKEARKSLKSDDVPVGAIIVKNNKVIAKAHNTKEKHKNSICHAEISVISKACKKLKTWRLDDCEMYVTLEPCLMCAGAILHSRISKLYFSTCNEKFGYISSLDCIMNKRNTHKIEIFEGIHKKESQKLLTTFFKDKRK